MPLEHLQMFVYLLHKSKYRRKRDPPPIRPMVGGRPAGPHSSVWRLALLVLLALSCHLGPTVLVSSHGLAGVADPGKCSEVRCMNGGVCKNGTCLCPDGWQGSECQFCGGKVRLTEPSGSIHDGLGNYSIGVKCSWLIDAREHNSITDKVLTEPGRPSVIRLHLEEFATECGWDHLYVYDGDSVESPLLAVFSGLMYRKNFTIRRIPEVFAHSGSALLHFFSDDAYNMSGFNISYQVNACPTNDSSLNCSGNGDCWNGECSCNSGFTGAACNIPRCPNYCSAHLGRGVCDRKQQRCVCSAGYTGNDCSQAIAHGYWTAIDAGETEGFTPPGSASHGAAVFHDTLYVIAGESYGKAEALLYMYDFNGKVWETAHTESRPAPELRYGASTVIFGDKIFMYGGVIEGRGVCGELWAFDVSAKIWENITVKAEQCNDTYEMCGPLRSAGHTATIVSNYDQVGGKKVLTGGGSSQKMVVIFGHSPQFGYLNTVQEFNFGTREWRIVPTRGYPVKGGYGHSAAYDPLRERIYVYGGIVSESDSSQLLSNKLYSYEPHERLWTLLETAPTARFLHTANFLTPGLMMVFGGNTHNDTSHSFGAKCYSRDLMVYDVLCDSWHAQPMPDDLYADLARFGHSAVVFERSLYVYGGFDGQMVNDMLQFTPGDCQAFNRTDQCLNARPGVKCVWDIQKSRCLPAAAVQRERLFDRDQEGLEVCPKKSRLVMTQHELMDYELCSQLTTCQGCVSTAYGCMFCGIGNGKGICVKEKCPDVSYTYRADFYPTKALKDCPDNDEHVCAQLHGCHACTAVSVCHWDYEHSRCQYSRNKSGDALNDACPPACSGLTSCGNCTQEECIWCQNEQRCVDKNAYTASFPYGQCREWTTGSSKCRAASSGKSQCGFYRTCAQCRDDPACGWCDDGSLTGLGKCLPGGDSGAHEESECPAQRWHFTHCPSCQCNGHSTCPDAKTCKQPCSNLTFGPNCDKCKPGFWGNPVNGGICQKCECNGQAQYCHSETGKCFCSTKGLAGDHCEKCDATNHYHGDPSRGSCYYDLTIDYQFTFNLSKKEDRHFTQINFRNSPVKPDIDADFTITCSVAARMNITIRTAGGIEKPLFSAVNCSTFRYRFSKAEHQFGVEDNVTLTTFYVYVYDFQPPLWIQIAFSQYPKLNLQQFFITFSTCFLLLLVMAAILWKIKQHYDMFRRRQRLFVEMEQMASRPFSQVLVEIESREYNELSPAVENITAAPRKRKKDSPSPIALEPCEGNRAAVLSLLVRLPTGGLQHSPPGQSAGLAVASALVTLGNPRRSSIEHPKEPKTKRKQSQHPDSCI
ncbi:attractin [Anopheles merus]|uniref:Attractin n=1 Tax=Anopheles merus TaxID=30066 RepID=A0A182VIW5_ANOME|nr:attractin [Anopheles merus]